MILLFKNILNSMLERAVLFILLFSLILYITKNVLYSFIGSVVLFLLLNLLIRQRNYIESFKNESSEEEEHIDTKKHEDSNKNYKEKLDSVDEQIEKYKNDPKIKKSAENIQEFLKKLNGNIELKSSDVEETKPLGVNTDDYSDDKKYNALKAAQKETYQLIDSVSALKDTVTTLQPVLSQGKELMDLFHNFKF
tara:strand:- start:305 stop:886 length:582 start_codon:yes stop_codon:yes gene_type:complete